MIPTYTFDQLPEAVNQLHARLESIEQLLHASLTGQAHQVDQLLTVTGAATFLNLTVPTIYSKVSRCELPVMKQGKRLYFSQTDLLNYLKQGRKNTFEEATEIATNYQKK